MRRGSAKKTKPRQPHLGAQSRSHGKCQESFVTPSPPVLALLSALTVDEDVTVRSSLMQSMVNGSSPSSHVTKPLASLVELWDLALFQEHQQQLKVCPRDEVRFSIAADGRVVLTVLKGVPFEDDAMQNHVGTLKSSHRDGTVSSNVSTLLTVSLGG
ncbi:hypothetical protein PsorP6_007587 [Peronosclerospora sorghi]|uniref:Uncharacterized protein n=1 Tax=Peronosclerospora sorghi TaxID=230839 RepID=A0ACC0W8U1_9STRA|nr:hypothetical protein PsorP6_007587 [Peronosclerospora sorghi]